jgi:hypothetical protein
LLPPSVSNSTFEKKYRYFTWHYLQLCDSPTKGHFNKHLRKSNMCCVYWVAAGTENGKERLFPLHLIDTTVCSSWSSKNYYSVAKKKKKVFFYCLDMGTEVKRFYSNDISVFIVVCTFPQQLGLKLNNAHYVPKKVYF